MLSNIVFFQYLLILLDHAKKFFYQIFSRLYIIFLIGVFSKILLKLIKRDNRKAIDLIEENIKHNGYLDHKISEKQIGRYTS